MSPPRSASGCWPSRCGPSSSTTSATATPPSPNSSRRSAQASSASKHLGILHDAAMVTHTKDGNHVRYPIADEGVFELREQASWRRYAANSTTLDALLQPSARAPDWEPGVSRRTATLRPQRSFNRRSLIPWFAVVSTTVTVCQPNAR